MRKKKELQAKMRTDLAAGGSRETGAGGGFLPRAATALLHKDPAATVYVLCAHVSAAGQRFPGAIEPHHINSGVIGHRAGRVAC